MYICTLFLPEFFALYKAISANFIMFLKLSISQILEWNNPQLRVVLIVISLYIKSWFAIRFRVFCAILRLLSNDILFNNITNSSPPVL